MTQDHYWKEFYRLKVHVTYVEGLLERTELVDRSLKMATAIVSSVSIGGWLIWKDYAIVWAFIIAASQVLTAVRPYLPYKERLKCVAGLMADFSELLLVVEAKWLDIADGELTDAETKRALATLRTQRNKALRKHLPDRVLPNHDRLLQKAEVATMAYYDHFYKELP